MKKRILAAILAISLVVTGLSITKPAPKEVKAAGTVSNKDMLGIKVQTKTNADETVDLRILSSVDSLDYEAVGFQVWYGSAASNPTNQNVTATFTTTTVLDRIEAGVSYNFSPQIIDTSSEYFVTGTIRGISPTKLDQNFYVKTFCIPSGGTASDRVYGPGRFFSVSDATATRTVNVPLAMSSNPGTTLSNITLAGIQTQATVLAYLEGYAHLRVTVPYDYSSKKTLPSASIVAVGENKTIYRNLESPLTVKTSGTTVTVTGDETWITKYLELNPNETEFVIASAADLYGLASYTNSHGMSGKKIYLIADIDLNDGKGTASESGFVRSDGTTPYPWEPIGNWQYFKFDGSFDGNMHTISGLYANSTSQCQALFEATYGATIENIRLENSYIQSSDQWVGSIVGRGFGGMFNNLYSNAIVKGGRAFVGGLFGQLETSAATLNSCWFDGTIVSTSSGNSAGFVGGLVGYAAGPVTISSCLNSGHMDITGTSNTEAGTGGFIGVNANTVTIRDSLMLGTLKTAGQSGAFAVTGRIDTRSYSGTNNYVMVDKYSTDHTTYDGAYPGATISGFGVTRTTYGNSLGDTAMSTLAALDWVNTWRTIDGETPMQKVFATDYVDTDWYDDYKNQAIYIIKSRQDLNGVRALVNAGFNFTGKTIALGNDIVINETDVTDFANVTPQYNWKSIGTKERPFKGTFDGRGYSISGVYQNVTTQYCALFGATNGATIQNLKLENSYFASTDQWVGSFAAISSGGTFKNLYSDATVRSARAFIGGIVGQADTTLTTFEECWFDGQVISTSAGNSAGFVGGIVGYAANQVSLTNCLTTGNLDISATANTTAGAGGLIGVLDAINKTSSINNTAMIGTITTAGQSGFYAVVGQMRNGTFSGSNVYVMVDRYSTAHSHFQGAYPGATIAGFSPVRITYANVQGDAATTTMPALDWNKIWYAFDGKAPMLREFADNYVDTAWYDQNKNSTTYTLETRQDLYGLAALVNSGVNFAGKTITLANDIVVNTTDISLYETIKPKYKWKAIGTWDRPFKGTFDGNGHIISGLYTKVGSQYSGLFGAVQGATIKDLKLKNSYFNSPEQWIGSIVGRGYGTFTNIYSDAIVKGEKAFVGGMFGQLDASSSTLTKCWFDGTVTSTSSGNSAGFVGGIAGYAAAAVTLTNCLTTGHIDISGTNNTVSGTGGFIGVNASTVAITNSAMLGTIKATGKTGFYSLIGRMDSRGLSGSNIYVVSNRVSTDHSTFEGAYPGATISGLSVTSVTHESVIGTTAKTTMSKLDWSNAWQTTNGSPALQGVKDVAMFSYETDLFEYHNVPKMVCSNATFTAPDDFGRGDYRIKVTGSTVDEYKAYLRLLKSHGFEKHSDNGTDGMEGNVYNSVYSKDGIILNISHEVRTNTTYLVASAGESLSPYLAYQAGYMNSATSGAKVKVHMLELHNNGNSFIFELKNGHFVIYDGGQDIDAPYLLDYLEALTPGDTKPVIEAWFISHAHWDHVGALMNTYYKQSDRERIAVQGIYITEPSKDICESYITGDENWQDVFTAADAYTAFKDENGNQTKCYRMHLGQRYYFCGVTIDVPHTLEQIDKTAYACSLSYYYNYDFNDSSTWFMATIEGQKFLCGGDGNYVSQQAVMKRFSKSYLTLDVFATLHHGINVRDDFTDYCTLKTVLYTNWRTASPWKSKAFLAAESQNAHLRASCQEYVSHGNGTVVLTFPYTVGSYKIQPACDWRYDDGVKKWKEN